MVDVDVNTLAVETGVLWGEGDVLRKCEARLCSSVGASPVVHSFADVGVLVRAIDPVAASLFTGFLSVVTAPSVEMRTTRISGLVGGSCFPATVCTVVGPPVRDAVLDGGWGLGTRG